MDFDENSSANLLVDDAPIAASAAPTKTPTSKRATTASRNTKSTARGGVPSAKSTGVSCITGLGAKDAVTALVKSANLAVQVGTANWSHQDSFVHSIKEGLGNKDIIAGLAEHTAIIVSALATCQTCGRSGTQTETLHVFQSLFETAPLRKRLDTHLDVAFAAIVSIVAHNSSQFLDNAARDTMLAAMRSVNAAKITLNLAKEINSEKHEKNVPKMTALAGLAADGMEMLVHGYFPRLDETAASTGAAPLQDLPQKITYYKDLLCAIVKLDKLPHAAHRAAASRMLKCLAVKGEANHTLVAMVREMRSTNRNVEQHFVQLYKEITGNQLAAVTNGAATASANANAASTAAAATVAASLASSPSTSRRAGSLTSLNVASSPLPASARKGALGKGSKNGWAATMPKEILSPVPVMPSASAVSAATQLSTATHALPIHDDHDQAEYNTCGAGLLDDETLAGGAGGDRTSLCFNYTHSPRLSIMEPSPSAASAAAAANAEPSVPVERQLQFAAGGEEQDEEDEEDGSVVLINHAAGPAVSPSAAAMVDAEAASALDVTRTPPSASAASVAASPIASAAAAGADLNSSYSFNYGRGSMMAGIGATAPAGLLGLASPPPAAAAKARSRSSGQKRKAVSGDEEIPASVAELSAQSPNTKLNTLKALTQQLKKQKGDAGAAIEAQAQGHTLTTAVQLLGEVQSAHITKVSAQLAEQSQFWESKRAKLKVKRSAQQQQQ